jgi:hypothetical protein
MAKKSRNSAGVSRTEREFNPDYTEIQNDLKRIGLLAGIFLAILIVLSFVL